jgi:signal transduction histidine kinase
VVLRISDITEEKLMERQLIQNEKLASLGLLVSSIAHEINNPNSFITFNIPIMRDYLNELTPIIDEYVEGHPGFEPLGFSYTAFREDLFKILDNIEHGSTRINTTVSGLKNFSRRKGKKENRSVDLKQVIDKTVAICRGEIRKKVKSFEMNVPEDLPMIHTDPEAIEQILLNHLINATQAVDKKTSRLRLDVMLKETGPAHLIVEVSDNGCGMDESTKKKIFDPFFTTKQPDMGTGLGLYVCHNLVEGLGGRIEVESKPGEGSTFRVILPFVIS